MAVTVGFPVALTGGLGALGRQAANGLTLWSRQTSLPVSLLVRDDRSQASVAAEQMAALLSCDWLAGPYGSASTLAAAAVARQRVLWNHGGASDLIHERYGRHVVSLLSPCSRYLGDVPRLMRGRAVAVFNPQGTFSSQVLRALPDVPRLPFGEPVPPCDTLVLVGRYQQELALLQALEPRPPVIVAVAAGVKAFGRDLGPLAEGVIGPAQWLPGSDSFSTSYEAAFGEVPDYPAAAAYAQGLLWEALVERAGTDESAMAQAARSLDIETFYGRFRLDPEGRQVGHQVRLVRWHAGRQEPL
ncbi:MAG TPA: ABC transporter substrate-binding protein [Candidatus Xenobia bacterium]|jgi:ABC-type branched-subunit amino acid transport system substrate-binding protein